MTNQSSSPPKHYECEKCKDTEWLEAPEGWYPCECRQVKIFRKIYEKSGITKSLENKTFENFITTGKPPIIKSALTVAKKYIETFSQAERKPSITFAGQVGAGKTHLCIAILNELMKKGVATLYMQYREAITALKQSITQDEIYQAELNRYKSAPVLFIDDLFKGRITESDINIMFEIINYRYINQKPILVSTEHTSDKLLQFDEAISSRIIEMSKGFFVELEGENLNNRMV